MLASPLEAARRGSQRSEFRPPATIVRSSLKTMSSSGLTAAAAPWSPTTSRPAKPENISANGPKPPAPLHSTPPLNPVATSVVPPPAALDSSLLSRAPGSIESHTALSNQLSPLTCTTPISTSKNFMTEAAIESGVFTYDMMMSLRKDCSHTPRRILNWAMELYRATPMFKVPPHLTLTLNEPLVEVDSSDRGTSLFGGGSRRPVRIVRQIHHKVMSVLSRVTPQKYVELQRELFELPLKQTTDAELKDVVKVFFEKAVQEQTFCPLYANLVADICKIPEAERDLDKEAKEKLLAWRMRRELLTTCQEEFQRPIQLSEDDKVDPNTGRQLASEEIEAKRDRLKKRLCGNIKFVGELFKKKLVTERVVGSIMDLLVSDFDPQKPNAKEDYVFEVFQTLLRCVGGMCQETNPEMLRRFMGMAKRVQEHHPTARIRFLMMDLEDLAKKGWQQRDRLLTMEEKEREMLESQRRGFEEIERIAKANQRELTEQIVANAAAQHAMQMAPPPPPPPPPFSATHSMAPPSHVMKPPALNQINLRTPHTEVKHPHGTPSSSPAKGKSNFTTTNTASGLQTPPPKYNRAAVTAERSPVVHPNTNVSLPHVLSNSHLPDSLHSSSMTRPSSSASLSGSVPVTPVSPGPLVPVHDLAASLMDDFSSSKKSIDDVLAALRTLSHKHRVHCMIHWLRRATGNTRYFNERDQIVLLFNGIIAAAASNNALVAVLSPHDLAVLFLEWLRYDTEVGQFENCPRLYANIGGIISHAYAANCPAKDPKHMLIVRSILNGMSFAIILRELHAHEKFTVIPTLVKDALPIVQQIVTCIPDSDDPRVDVLNALQNRFRVIPFILYGDGAKTRCQTPTTPTLGARAPPSPNLRGSPLNESVGSFDPFSQCLAFPKVAEDIEFLLFRKMRKEESASAWKDFAVSIATAAAPAPNTSVMRLTQVMKVVCTLLSVLHPKDATQPLIPSIKAEDLDYVIHTILSKKKSAVEYQAAIVAELMMHFTYTVANITSPATAESPSKHAQNQSQMNSSMSEFAGSWTNIESRMSKMQTIFRRWCSSGMIDGEKVLAVLKSIQEVSTSHHAKGEEIVAAAAQVPQEDFYTLQHNFMVEASWLSALLMLN